MQPQICDEDTLRADSELLKRVEILEGDFENTCFVRKVRYYFILILLTVHLVALQVLMIIQKKRSMMIHKSG